MNNDDKVGELKSRWKTADQIAKTYGYSRPWVYNIADRFNIRTVSLAESGKTGSRFFDFAQLEKLIETLAEEQKGQPRINPRAPKAEVAHEL